MFGLAGNKMFGLANNKRFGLAGNKQLGLVWFSKILVWQVTKGLV